MEKEEREWLKIQVVRVFQGKGNVRGQSRIPSYPLVASQTCCPSCCPPAISAKTEDNGRMGQRGCDLDWHGLCGNNSWDFERGVQW
jgi:hypothetical protein